MSRALRGRFHPLLGLFMVLFLVGSAAAKTREGAPEPAAAKPSEYKLASKYVGVFRWDSELITQKVMLVFTSTRMLDEGTMEALGDGTYNDSVKIKVRARVNLTTGAIEIWESEPSTESEDGAGFQSNGSHQGSLTQGGSEINAVWTTNGSSERGQLHLSSID